MKKGLLLSVVASGVLFAGGNIAPVEPVQQVAPAACDFWGTLAFRYDAQKKETAANDWKDDSRSYLAVAMGVEKELGYGFGVGAELGAIYSANYKFQKIDESAELSQLYITYKAGNTAIKAGRQALPKTLSPWAWSDRTAGVLERAYNGIVVVNTDIANTTLVGAWIASFTDSASATKIDAANGSNKGLFMLAAEYKGIADTTLRASAYYVPKFLDTDDKAFSIWTSAETKVNNVNLGLQVAYAKASALTKSFGVAAYVGSKFDAIDAKLTLAYLNDGTTPLTLSGPNSGSGFWGGSYYVFGGNVSADKGKQKIARLDVGYTLADKSRIYAGVAANKPDNGSTEIAARIGYDFTVKGVAAKVEYRFNKDYNSNKNHRVRVQGVYKF